MTAFNVQQVVDQINNFKSLAEKIAEVQTLIYQVLENEEVVSQTWNNLGDDFPSLVGGTQQNTDPVILAGVEQTFSPQQLNQYDNAIQDIASALDGIDITVTTNLGRNIRRLTDGVV